MADAHDCSALPSWLTTPENYEPTHDHDGFIVRSMLAVTSVLTQLRLDGAARTPLSPSAPIKLVFALVSVLLVSLSHSFAFVLTMLAGVILRASLMPRHALARVASVTGLAAALTFVLMLPSALMGQVHAAPWLAVKALTCTGAIMEMALSMSAAELTEVLAAFRVPDVAILTLELALRSIVTLGDTALEALEALRLRSVGHNPNKQSSIAGVGGVVLVKAAASAQDSYDAMRCRGFEGEYSANRSLAWRSVDVAWLVLLAGIFIAFIHFQGVM